MAAVRKTREQIAAERAAELKAFEKYKKTQPSKEALAARNAAPVKPLTAAERAARTQAMGEKKRKIMQERLRVNRSNAKPAPLAVAPKAPRRGTATPVPLPKITLRGPAAIAELQRQVSPKGIKKTESGAKKAIDKKYPGLYKK